MLSRKLKYVDYNGVEREETFNFNFTKAELMEMELGTTGGLSEMIKKLIESQDAPAIVKTFKDLVLAAYGVKSDDGKRFIKNDKLREEFSQTEAYSQLFMELALDAKKAAAFVNGIVPAEVQAELAKQNNPSAPANI